MFESVRVDTSIDDFGYRYSTELLIRARTFKCLWGPGIDAKE
jgi:hypothetical protein